MRFDVHEEIEQGVFNTSSSYFWTQFREQFADQIVARYKAQRSYSSSHSTYTERSFLEYFYDKQVAKISETNYNNNFKQKYFNHEDYLFMMHGRQYEFFRRWISQRLYFLDSYYEYGSDWSKTSTVRVEYGSFATTPVTFKIKTYQPSYVAVKFTAAAGNTKKLKVPRGGEITFQGYVDTATDQEVIIYNAPIIKTLGDLSPYSPKVVELSNMSKLTSLTVGSQAHPNPNLSSISLGHNSYLTKLVAENCTAISGQIDVSSCTNLQYISTKGSTIPYVKFNVNGGSLEEAHFSYATTTVNMNNFKLLNTITFESLTKLTTLQITNCPIITGSKVGNTITTGTIMNIINGWEPTDRSTKIELDCYGNLTDYKFLDACSLLHEQYGLTNRRINLTGHITYMGTTIPDRYSTYSSSVVANNYFPNLTIKYPNVTDFSNMFVNYKNINAIMSKTVPIRDNMNNVSYVLRYYWKDPKESTFSAQLDAEYNECGYRGRQLQYYDADDMKIVADEIKDRMSPFATATNMNNMFKNDYIIEYIHPETFDHMNVYNATTDSMFSGCSNLRYVEVPKVNSLDSSMFQGCNKAFIYVPSTVTTINSSAFTTTAFTKGVHPVVLFEGSKSDYPDEIPYVRDARFDIIKDSTGRALRTENIICPNLTMADVNDNQNLSCTNNPVTVKMKYFLNSHGKLVYNVEPLTGSSVTFNTWNCGITADNKIDVYANPLNISEMLYGSMKNIALGSLHTMAIPTYNITNLSPNTTALYREEVSIAKLFYDEVTTSEIKTLGNLKKVILLTGTSTKISNYFMQDNENISSVICEKELTEIGEYAFANCNMSEFVLQNVSTEPHLTSIGQYAFAGTKIQNIYIPDTVTYIGERAYERNNHITELKYSMNMTQVPIGCFANCNTGSISTETIYGFNPEKLTAIRDYAFDKSIGLLVVQTPETSDDPYACYWCNDPSKSKFLDYFPNLTEIGNGAFRGISNIKKIKLTPTLQAIGSSAFIPPQVEYAKPTLLEWSLNDDDDYSICHLYSEAFAGRQFNWNSVNYNGFTGIIDKTVFIPSSFGAVDADAFSPTSSSCSSTSKLDYVITDAVSKPTTWNKDFVQHYIEMMYNYYSTVLYNNNESMYFLKNNNEALYIKLLKETPSINIPAKIQKDSTDYTVKRIANYAFTENDDMLNIISFGKGSTITEFGYQIFDTDTVNAMYVDDTYDLNNNQLIIPTTLTFIDAGTPFKNSAWFTLQSNDNFIYLNDVCIGYGENEVPLITAISGESPLSIKATTRVIYDNAFQNERITSIPLPAQLERIGDFAFANCTSLTSISFLPCQNTLTYIGSSVFKGDFNLKAIRYTKALTHVGYATTDGCMISSIIFDQGCHLDNTSEPIKAKSDNILTGLDETITFLKISDSMGSFFAPNGVGYAQFSKLSNLKDLILGEYTEYNLSPVPTAELTESEASDPDTYYKLDLTNYFTNATYSDGGTTKNIILHTKDSKFYAPSGTYTNDINISKVTTNLLDQVDVVRIVMGYKNGETHTIYAKRDFTQQTTASMFRSMFNNRVATITVTN